jgi:crotonobetaine/carnitine-CoA ligase
MSPNQQGLVSIMYKVDLSTPANRVFPKILQQQAQHNGSTEFLLTDTQRITFAQADDISSRLAMGLQSLGVGQGDRVCLYLGNCPQFVLLTLAINKLGAVWVPVNTDYKGEWLRDTIERWI